MKEHLDQYYTAQRSTEQSLDLFVHGGDENNDNNIKNKVLLVFVHGGLWVDGDKKGYKTVANRYVNDRCDVAIVNYRLSAKTALTQERVVEPQHTEDVAGHSCGAHMAALLVMNPDSTFFGGNDNNSNGNDKKNYADVHRAIVGVIGVEGLYDNGQFCEDFPEWCSELLLSRNGGDCEQWLDPSCLAEKRIDTVAVRRCKWLIIHSPKDAYVNMRQPEDFLKQLRHLEARSVHSIFTLRSNHFDVVREETPEGCDDVEVVTAAVRRMIEEIGDD